MIIDMILNFMYMYILGVVDLLPSLPQFEFFSGLSGFLELLSWGLIFVDVNVFIGCISLWFALYNFEFVYAILEWVWKKIPGVQ